MKIKKLSPEVQTNFRTGVSMTDVSQCITELVQNSLDAQSTSVAVRVDLEALLLQVVDNGHGLTKNDLDLIGVRYMTSKCHSLNDFRTNLKYYGFRGESLASLRDACGVLMIISKPKGSDQTYSKVFRANKARSHNAILSTHNRLCVGTTVIVKDFLLNLPVRRARIQSNIEMEDVRQALLALSIINHKVSFTLRNDVSKTVILQTKIYKDSADALKHLCNLQEHHCLVPVSEIISPFKVSANISRETEQSNHFQFIYVNGRLVKNKNMYKLVNKKLSKSFYLRNIGKEVKVTNDKPKEKYFSVFVINIQCPHVEYDITSDPRKQNVEFRKWDVVMKCMENIVDRFISTESNLNGVTEKSTEVVNKVLPSIQTKVDSTANWPMKSNVLYGNTIKRHKFGLRHLEKSPFKNTTETPCLVDACSEYDKNESKRHANDNQSDHAAVLASAETVLNQVERTNQNGEFHDINSNHRNAILSSPGSILKSDIETPFPFKVPTVISNVCKRKRLTEHIITESESDCTPAKQNSFSSSIVLKTESIHKKSILPIVSQEFLASGIRNIISTRNTLFNYKDNLSNQAPNQAIQIDIYRSIKEVGKNNNPRISHTKSLKYLDCKKGDYLKCSARTQCTFLPREDKYITSCIRGLPAKRIETNVEKPFVFLPSKNNALSQKNKSCDLRQNWNLFSPAFKQVNQITNECISRRQSKNMKPSSVVKTNLSREIKTNQDKINKLILKKFQFKSNVSTRTTSARRTCLKRELKTKERQVAAEAHDCYAPCSTTNIIDGDENSMGTNGCGSINQSIYNQNNSSLRFKISKNKNYIFANHKSKNNSLLLPTACGSSIVDQTALSFRNKKQSLFNSLTPALDQVNGLMCQPILWLKSNNGVKDTTGNSKYVFSDSHLNFTHHTKNQQSKADGVKYSKQRRKTNSFNLIDNGKLDPSRRDSPEIRNYAHHIEESKFIGNRDATKATEKSTEEVKKCRPSIQTKNDNKANWPVKSNVLYGNTMERLKFGLGHLEHTPFNNATAKTPCLVDACTEYEKNGSKRHAIDNESAHAGVLASAEPMLHQVERTDQNDKFRFINSNHRNAILSSPGSTLKSDIETPFPFKDPTVISNVCKRKRLTEHIITESESDCTPAKQNSSSSSIVLKTESIHKKSILPIVSQEFLTNGIRNIISTRNTLFNYTDNVSNQAPNQAIQIDVYRSIKEVGKNNNPRISHTKSLKYLDCKKGDYLKCSARTQCTFLPREDKYITSCIRGLPAKRREMNVEKPFVFLPSKINALSQKNKSYNFRRNWKLFSPAFKQMTNETKCISRNQSKNMKPSSVMKTNLSREARTKQEGRNKFTTKGNSLLLPTACGSSSLDQTALSFKNKNQSLFNSLTPALDQVNGLMYRPILRQNSDNGVKDINGNANYGISDSHLNFTHHMKNQQPSADSNKYSKQLTKTNSLNFTGIGKSDLSRRDSPEIRKSAHLIEESKFIGKPDSLKSTMFNGSLKGKVISVNIANCVDNVFVNNDTQNSKELKLHSIQPDNITDVQESTTRYKSSCGSLHGNIVNTTSESKDVNNSTPTSTLKNSEAQYKCATGEGRSINDQNVQDPVIVKPNSSVMGESEAQATFCKSRNEKEKIILLEHPTALESTKSQETIYETKHSTPFQSKPSYHGHTNKQPLDKKMLEQHIELDQTKDAVYVNEPDEITNLCDDENIKHTWNLPNKKLDNEFNCQTKSVKWKKETMPNGKSIYVNIETGMSLFFTPKHDINTSYGLHDRHWFMPKGSSPILGFNGVSNDNMKQLTEIEKNTVKDIVGSSNTIDLTTTIKWKESKSQGMGGVFQMLSGFGSKEQFGLMPCFKKPCVFSSESLHNAKVLGQVDNKFIAALLEPNGENKSILVLFDQHAVDERIRLEALTAGYKQSDGQLISQSLNPCVEIDLTENERAMLTYLLPRISKLGLKLALEQTKISATAVPLCLFNRAARENQADLLKNTVTAFVKQLLVSAEEFRGVIPAMPHFISDVINSEACRGAIKFGDGLTLEKSKLLVSNLALCEMPFQCAHGRPVLTPLTEINEDIHQDGPTNLEALVAKDKLPNQEDTMLTNCTS